MENKLSSPPPHGRAEIEGIWTPIRIFLVYMNGTYVHYEKKEWLLLSNFAEMIVIYVYDVKERLIGIINNTWFICNLYIF